MLTAPTAPTASTPPERGVHDGWLVSTIARAGREFDVASGKLIERWQESECSPLKRQFRALHLPVNHHLSSPAPSQLQLTPNCLSVRPRANLFGTLFAAFAAFVAAAVDPNLQCFLSAFSSSKSFSYSLRIRGPRHSL